MAIALNQKRSCTWPESSPPAKACVHNRSGITALPPELVAKILANLGSRDLMVCKRVSRAWSRIVDTTPLLPRMFYRRLHPQTSVPELSIGVNRPYSPSHCSSISHWLRCFSEQGHTLARALDELAEEGAQVPPEGLFFPLARILAAAPIFHCWEVCTIRHSQWINRVNFSPDGRYVVTASNDKTAKVCACIGGQWQQIFTLTHPDMVHHAYFSPTGDYCVTTCCDGTVHVWEVLGAGEPWPSHVILPHCSVVCMPPCFSADGNHLVILPTQHTTEILQLVNGQWQEQTTLLDGHYVDNALFHPWEPVLATVHDDVNVYIWRLVTGEWKQDVMLQHASHVNDLHFSPDGSRLFLTSLKVDPARGSNVSIYNRAGGTWRQDVAPPLTTDVHKARFSANGDKLIIVSARQHGVNIWRFANNRWQDVILPQAEIFINANFSPDGDRLVTHTKHNTAILWKEVQGQWQQEATLSPGTDYTDMLGGSHFSPHGHHLVTLSYDQDAKIWGIVNGTWQEKSCSSLGKVREGIFSPDGLYFLARHRDNTVHIWTFRQG